jgi:hypothetical protein
MPSSRLIAPVICFAGVEVVRHERDADEIGSADDVEHLRDGGVVVAMLGLHDVRALAVAGKVGHADHPRRVTRALEHLPQAS